MMIAIALVAVFFATYFTGPAGQDTIDQWRTRRRLRLDAPSAKVLYLPTAACRDDFARVDAVDVVDV